MNILRRQKTRIEGKVFVSFVVEKDSTLSNLKVVRGLGHGCDEEAIRIIKEGPKWKPAIMRGKVHRQSTTVPIIFRLMSIDDGK